MKKQKNEKEEQEKTIKREADMGEEYQKRVYLKKRKEEIDECFTEDEIIDVLDQIYQTGVIDGMNLENGGILKEDPKCECCGDKALGGKNHCEDCKAEALGYI